MMILCLLLDVTAHTSASRLIGNDDLVVHAVEMLTNLTVIIRAEIIRAHALRTAIPYVGGAASRN